MKKLTMILIPLLLSVLLLAGCSREDSDYQTFLSENGRFQVEAPLSWKDATGRFNKSADLELMDSKENTFFMVLSSDKTKHNGVLKDYLDSEVEKINNSYSPMNLTTTDEKVASHDATLYEFDTTVQTLTVHMRIYMFETEHYFTKAYIWSLKSDSEKNRDAVNMILNSITEQ